MQTFPCPGFLSRSLLCCYEIYKLKELCNLYYFNLFSHENPIKLKRVLAVDKKGFFFDIKQIDDSSTSIKNR